MPVRSRDRVARILAHQEADRVPFQGGFGGEVRAVIDGLDIPDDWREYCRTGDFHGSHLEAAPGHRETFAEFLPGLPDEAEVSLWGVGRLALKSVQGYHAGHTYYHPLAAVDTVAGLERYPWPDVAKLTSLESLTEEFRAARAEGFTVVGNLSQSILETGYLLRGMERLMMDFHDRLAFVHRLFEKLSEQKQAAAALYAQAGTDVVRIGDDIATQEGLMVSLGLYREFIKPRHRAIIEAARRANPTVPVLYHSDGNLTPLLRDLIEIGVTAINPVQPECMDLAAVKREYGRDLVLWGCMPVQSVFAHGTGEDVLAHLRFLMDEVTPGGGLILQFTNVILTPRVLDNLGVFFCGLLEMGKYR